LLGARQVGKTYSVQAFAAERFEHVVYANFQTEFDRLARLFAEDLRPERLVRDLGHVFDTVITPGRTLLVFDEVQLCQPALSSLKYFAEDMPDLAVIATCSLFGVTVHRDERYSFPVGKVDLAHLYPMDFEEYLWAVGHEGWTAGIRESFAEDRPFAAHADALRACREYMVVGGLPEAVADFAERRDFERARRVQLDIAALYTADMALCLDGATAARTRAVWDSAPRQLAREQNKFKLADIRTGARLHHYEAPFAWLEAVGLIHRHYQAHQAEAPLEARDGGAFFKVYLLDTGLLTARLGIRPSVFLDPDAHAQLASGVRGGVTENYVKQALSAAEMESFYWSSGNTAEVDFLVQDARMRVVPIEAKSGPHSRSKSLAVYRAKHRPAQAVRLTTLEFGAVDGLKSVPLYAAFCLDGLIA
jgi:predicted AAA+ superfamily ATPase